ncbi:hypothetical protein J6590_037772 [Homalodisca vitripennis]|nr:hypothetical protein J6590_037772 [Homalodisca vitripennis]
MKYSSIVGVGKRSRLANEYYTMRQSQVAHVSYQRCIVGVNKRSGSRMCMIRCDDRRSHTCPTREIGLANVYDTMRRSQVAHVSYQRCIVGVNKRSGSRMCMIRCDDRRSHTCPTRGVLFVWATRSRLANVYDTMRRSQVAHVFYQWCIVGVGDEVEAREYI